MEELLFPCWLFRRGCSNPWGGHLLFVLLFSQIERVGSGTTSFLFRSALCLSFELLALMFGFNLIRFALALDLSSDALFCRFSISILRYRTTRNLEHNPSTSLSSPKSRRTSRNASRVA